MVFTVVLLLLWAGSCLRFCIHKKERVVPLWTCHDRSLLYQCKITNVMNMLLYTCISPVFVSDVSRKRPCHQLLLRLFNSSGDRQVRKATIRGGVGQAKFFPIPAYIQLPRNTSIRLAGSQCLTDYLHRDSELAHW